MKKKLSGLLICIVCLSFTGVAFALTPLERLGKRIYEDPAYSVNGNQSCQSCHHPKADFSDPVNRISPMYRPVSEGSHAGLFGGRNAPPAAYAAYSPALHWDGELFVGGLFWDGRATGRAESSGTGDLGAGPTGDPLADQAKGPFGNPVEMGLVNGLYGGTETTEELVVGVLRSASYRRLYNKAFPDAVPIARVFGSTEVNTAYNNIALAIAAFEKSSQVNKFRSKFDEFREQLIANLPGYDINVYTIDDYDALVSALGANKVAYTREEAEGLDLFNSLPRAEGGTGGGCFQCHPVGDMTTADGTVLATVFTDFSYDNLGVPQNPVITELGVEQTQDIGLQSQKDILRDIWKADNGGQTADMTIFWNQVYPAQRGKHKVSSLRNIARTAPYGHNGFFPTLYDIVHFYNTRDVRGAGWPNPEVWANVNDAELGNLGLTFEEEQKIVVFLETLTDE